MEPSFTHMIVMQKQSSVPTNDTLKFRQTGTLGKTIISSI